MICQSSKVTKLLQFCLTQSSLTTPKSSSTRLALCHWLFYSVLSTRIGFMYVIPSPSFSTEIALSCDFSEHSFAKWFPLQIKLCNFEFEPLPLAFPYEFLEFSAFLSLSFGLKSTNPSAPVIVDEKSETFLPLQFHICPWLKSWKKIEQLVLFEHIINITN